MVHYAPQPFVDLGHGIGPNTGPLGFAERIDTADQASGPLIVFKPHCNFHALPKQKVFISGVATDPESCVQMPENKSVVYVDLTDNIAKSEHVSLFISEGLSSQVNDFILTKLSDYTELYHRRIRTASDAPLTLYFQWSESAEKRVSFTGNAPSGQLLTSAEWNANRDIKTDTEPGRTLKSFLAHEATDLWQLYLGRG